MGNCLKSTTNDDISLLNGGRSNDSNRESIDQDQNIHFPETIQPIFYPSPSSASRAGGVSHLSEDEQIKIAKRIGLISHLPIHQFTEDNFKSKKVPQECDICMNDFVVGKFNDSYLVIYKTNSTYINEYITQYFLFQKGDSIRYLPCMHQYHVACVDVWLQKNLTCPTCCEPVDAGLFSSFETV
ncbi:unnamed protein product [Diamesa tonsa]